MESASLTALHENATQRHLAWRAEVAALKFRRALEAFRPAFLKAYNPDQPRVPAGNPDGGQWTTALAAGAAGSVAPVQLAGEPPTGEPPKIPSERPPTERERNRIARVVVRIPEPLYVVLKTAAWLQEKLPEMLAARDPPKSLQELQDAVSTPRAGYDIHHIVPQSDARADGFSEGLINGGDNLVSIPRYRHWELNSWYETPNEEFGGQRPREYLRGKEWNERREIGLQALINHKVLKP